MQAARRRRLVLDEHALGELEAQQARVEAGRLQHFADLLHQVRLQDLPSGDVDGEREARPARPHLLQGPHLPAGLGQHPASHHADDAGLLGHGNELLRRHEAPQAMLPADESLEFHDPHAVGHAARRSGVLHALEQEGELVVAEARDGVAGPADPVEPTGDGDEKLVAGAVPHRVVHQLEAVEIEEQHGERGAGPSARPRLRLAEPLHEQRPVGEPRQRVVEDGAPELLLRADAFGDVVGDHQPRLAAGEGQRVRGDLHVDGFAAGLAVAPDARRGSAVEPRREPLLQQKHVLFGPYSGDGHAGEFFAGVSVMINCGLIHREESQRFLVVDPHRQRADFEECCGATQRRRKRDYATCSSSASTGTRLS